MTFLTQEDLIAEIDICLGRNDLSEVEFTILHALKYLLLTQDKVIIEK